MKKVILIITILIFTSHSNSQGWVQQSSGTNGNLRSVYFVNVNTGFIVGDVSSSQTLVLKTTNGGNSWESQSPVSPTGKVLRCVFFTDANIGYCCGADGFLFGTGSGVIFKTTNSGINWSVNYSNFSHGLTAIHFVNANTGYTVGLFKNSTSPLLKTTNAGQNWTITASISFYRMFCVYFYDAQTGWAAGESGAIIKTTNGGINWSAQTSGTTSNLTSIQFIDAMTGYVTGLDSRVRNTTNGGQTWNLLYNQGLCGLYSIKFSNSLTGWVCGCEGAINGTTNSGSNWLLQSFATTTYLYSISFPSASTGWAVGAGGRILKTTSGGVTAIQPISNEIPEKFSLSQNYPNPFNPTTKIMFAIPNNSFVRLNVYDAIGRKIEILVNEHMDAGIYEAVWDGGNYSSGIYYYKFTAGEYSEARKMVLIK